MFAQESLVFLKIFKKGHMTPALGITGDFTILFFLLET